jgi:ABC-type transport system substrate-binding protein
MRGILRSVAILAAVMAAAVQLHAQSPKQGGAAVITFNNDFTTLDPQVGYDLQNYVAMRGIFDRLMDYRPGTVELVPSLAESYTISDDGKTYSFKLRDGVKFHNGRPLTSADVKYSLERAVNPKTQSPGTGYFTSIAGYDELSGGKAQGMSGITTPDDHTVEIKLSRPDATFLYALSLHFASIVPREEVEKSGSDWGRKPVGSGAFKFIEWVPGQYVTLERNKDYWLKGVPYLDKITFQFGQDPTVAVLRLKNGEVDVVGDGIPPAQFPSVLADPASKDLLVMGDWLQTAYVTMNVTKPPFDKLEVRQAVNMAINRDRIVRLINNRAVPTGQVLPPAMPGYDPNNKGYSHDPKAATALLAKAGYPNGLSTELYVMNVDPHPRIAQAIQQDLAAIGIKVEIKSLAQAEVIAAGGGGTAPMVWSGGMGWLTDFPDPAGFFGAILSCAGTAEGGWNWAKYCNKSIDERAAKADAMVKLEERAARIAEWQAIFGDIMKEAPWAPIYNEKHITYHSARVGADRNVFVDPFDTPLNYRYIYAKDAQ